MSFRAINIFFASGISHRVIPQRLLKITDTNVYVLYYRDWKNVDMINVAILDLSEDGIFQKRPITNYDSLEPFIDNHEYENVSVDVLPDTIKCGKLIDFDKLLNKNLYNEKKHIKVRKLGH